MDLRALIALIPFTPARAPLHALLDRLEAVERRQAEQAERLAALESRNS